METNHLNKPAYRSKHEDAVYIRHQNHTMWGRKVRKYRFFFFILMMCLSLYDYQAKASRYKKGLTYLKNTATEIKTKQDSHKNKRRGHKHKIKGKNLQPRILYPARISFKIEGEIKNFSKKQNLTEYSNTKPILKEILKGLL